MCFAAFCRAGNKNKAMITSGRSMIWKLFFPCLPSGSQTPKNFVSFHRYRRFLTTISLLWMKSCPCLLRSTLCTYLWHPRGHRRPPDHSGPCSRLPAGGYSCWESPRTGLGSSPSAKNLGKKLCTMSEGVLTQNIEMLNENSGQMASKIQHTILRVAIGLWILSVILKFCRNYPLRSYRNLLRLQKVFQDF